MSADELAAVVASQGALPMPVPVGPQMPPFPPAPQSFEEKLRADVARLQGLLAEAVTEKHRALRERDLMRERVSEPFGCALCGVEKRSHGRRYIGGAGMHAWERPTDEQVKDRMLARRAARFTSHPERLATLLVARTEELLAAEARVAELEAERAKYVGAEPTIAEEMAYLSRCIDSVLDLCSEAESKGITSGGPFTVEAVRKAADGLVERASYPPAFPWARLMDDEDRAEFLDELAESATTHASSDVVLAEVEETCKTWRLIAEAQHGHNTAPGPDAVTAVFVPVASLREPEGEHYRSVHHDYRVSHDLPETGGQR